MSKRTIRQKILSFIFCRHYIHKIDVKNYSLTGKVGTVVICKWCEKRIMKRIR